MEAKDVNYCEQNVGNRAWFDNPNWMGLLCSYSRQKEDIFQESIFGQNEFIFAFDLIGSIFELKHFYQRTHATYPKSCIFHD